MKIATKFNFNKLKDIYNSTLKSNDRAIAFDVQINKGKFLFMMYLSDEDEESKDMLFIYMRNTRVLLKLKMYGSHRKGKFEVYIKEGEREKMIKELSLSHNGSHFDFNSFLDQLNEKIPLNISKENKIKILRNNKNIVSSLGMVDEAEKTILIGVRKLPAEKKPRDKTLRKLYLYTDANEADIDELIKLLKKFNHTVAWTTEDNAHKATDIRVLIELLS